MARLKSNILDGGSGRVGSVILYEWRGIHCMRSLPDFYKDKKSPAQLKQRQKMKLVHSFLGCLKPFINKTFFEGDVGRTPYQAAQSYNLKYGITGEYPDQQINFKTALIAKGEIPLPQNIEYERVGDSIIIKWDASETFNNKRSEDDLVVYTLPNLICYAKFIKTHTTRKDGICKLDNMFTDEEDNLKIWMLFRNQDKTQFSNSVCLNY